MLEYNMPSPPSLVRAMTSMKTELITSDAELALIARDGVEIHVSSDVLRVSSKFFQDSLDPTSELGRAFEKHVQSGIPTLFRYALDDDTDSGLMILLCRIMHGIKDPSADDIDADSLLAFVELAEHYDCLRTISPAAKDILARVWNDPTKADRSKIVYSAFALDCAEIFAAVTNDMLQDLLPQDLESLKREQTSQLLVKICGKNRG